MPTLTFLGTGTSCGVPVLGCSCEVCTSSDTRNQRLRTSALITTEAGERILFDCSPDFRCQLMQRFLPLTAIFLSHEHYDHIGGLEDLRPISLFENCPIYAEQSVIDSIKQRLPYCFATHKYPGVPRLDFLPLTLEQKFSFASFSFTPVRVFHGKLPIIGFQSEKDWAYITDMKTIEAREKARLKGVKVLILNALREAPHHSHLSLSEAIAFAQEVEAGTTYLIHFSHEIGLHEEVQKRLPKNIFMAYDGLEIKI